MPLASTAPIRLNSTELLLVVAAAPTVEPAALSIGKQIEVFEAPPPVTLIRFLRGLPKSRLMRCW